MPAGLGLGAAVGYASDILKAGMFPPSSSTGLSTEGDYHSERQHRWPYASLHHMPCAQYQQQMLGLDPLHRWGD